MLGDTVPRIEPIGNLGTVSAKASGAHTYRACAYNANVADGAAPLGDSNLRSSLL